MKRVFSKLALTPSELVFGRARYPVVRNRVTIGGGKVIPEIKFTLPSILIEEASRDQIRHEYTEMMTDVCRRAVELHQAEIVVEFELLPQMTIEPYWGEMITGLLREALEDFRTTDHLLSLLRVTPVDTREFRKPPLRREGKELDDVLTSFRVCAKSEGDLLSMESTGGKEVTDIAITETDMRGMLFGNGVLACAHLSAVGNIAGVYADPWRNESVQDVKLLSASAPVVSMEQLIYDCRLFNTSLSKHGEQELRDWLVESDAALDPQAFIFRPEIVGEIANTMISEQDYYHRTLSVARKTVELLKRGLCNQKLVLCDREQNWLQRIEHAVRV